MKPVYNTVFILLALLLVSCTPGDQPGKVQDDLEIASLKQLLALGKMTDLNAQSVDMQHELLVRLYEVPIFENDCFVETHGICQYAYFISVSSYDEYPETNVYKLPYQGELQGFKWLRDDTLDQEQIEFSFAKFSKAALKNNPTLVNQQSVIVTRLGPRTFSTAIK